MSTKGDYKVHLEFDDNEKAAKLFGLHDAHLRLIENALDVAILTRGNLLTIIGTETNAKRAREILIFLWEKIALNGRLEIIDVEAAIRITLAGGPQHDLQNLHKKENAIRTAKGFIMPKSHKQGDFVKTLNKHQMTFATGPAGTGKTYLAVAKAVEMFLQGKVQRIVLTRPAVEAGEKLGFLPGDLKEKIDPYLRPLYDSLYDMLPGEQILKLMQTGMIEVAPLAYMRGRTLSNAYIILDEAQNTTVMQMKMFLTRPGEGSQIVINGDTSQVDLPFGVESGLVHALRILKNIPDIGFITFSSKDVVRLPLVAKIIEAYDDDGARKNK